MDKALSWMCIERLIGFMRDALKDQMTPEKTSHIGYA